MPGTFGNLPTARAFRLSIEGLRTERVMICVTPDAQMNRCASFGQRGCYTGLPLCDIVEEMASAAHVYGKRILGAEAFTCWRGDFLDHPATLKPLGGLGILRRSEPSQLPPLGSCSLGLNVCRGSHSFTSETVFQRSLTWWEQSKPWHEYIARCQHIASAGTVRSGYLFSWRPRAGRNVLCRRFPQPLAHHPNRPEYNFDACPPELVLDGMRVRDGASCCLQG